MWVWHNFLGAKKMRKKEVGERKGKNRRKANKEELKGEMKGKKMLKEKKRN